MVIFIHPTSPHSSREHTFLAFRSELNPTADLKYRVLADCDSKESELTEGVSSKVRLSESEDARMEIETIYCKVGYGRSWGPMRCCSSS